MKKILNKKGFTLIELIVVILILAILAAILVPSILNYVGQAEDAKDQANARGLYSELSLAIIDTSITVPTPGDYGPSGCTFAGTTIATLEVTCNGWKFDGTSFTEVGG